MAVAVLVPELTADTVTGPRFKELPDPTVAVVDSLRSDIATTASTAMPPDAPPVDSLSVSVAALAETATDDVVSSTLTPLSSWRCWSP